MTQFEINPHLVRDVVDGLLHEVMLGAAIVAEREAKRLCPVDTGRLRGSITHEVTKDGAQVRAVVGTNVEYAAPVEYGTHAAGEPDAPGKVSHSPGGTAPRPFLRPGLARAVAILRNQGVIQ